MPDAVRGRRRATRWADRSLRSKGLVVIAVPVAVLVVVLATTVWFTHVDNRAQSVAGRARQVLETSTAVENDLLSVQTSLDGWLVTGDASFRSSYQRARAAAAGQLGRFVALTRSTPSARRPGQAIGGDGSLLLSHLAALAATGRRAGPSGLPPAPTQTLVRSSQAETAQLHSDVGTLSGEMDALILSQRSAIHRSSTLLPVVAIAAVVLAGAGGVLVSQLFTAGVVTRLRRLEQATQALEQGEVPEEVPTGQDEIGRLSTRLLRATEQMRERADERDRVRAELEDILTASPVVSLRYDVAARRFSYASPNIARLLGIPAEQACADPAAVMDRFHPDSAAELRRALVDGAGRHGDRLEILLRFRRDPGSEQWREAEGVYTVDTAPSGELVGVVAYLVDVSERHAALRAAEERRFLVESIFHASPDTIVVRDLEGRVVLASSDLATVTAPGAGSASDHLIELAHRFGTVPVEDRAVLDDLIARCTAGDRSPGPVVTSGRLAGGELRTYETRARPVFDQTGRVTGTVTVSRDVTDQMHLEQSLRHASAEAERASAAKSEFLSRMSHELRTPLNAILGFAQLLELDELPEDQASSIDQIQRAGHHLLSLINEVLDISRIEAGRLSLSTEPVDVGHVLDEVTTLLSPVAEAAGIELSVDVYGARSVRVRADRQRLLQVLLNLGSNALKYNSRGGAVAFRTGRGQGRRVRFEVRDTGPGIPAEQQSQLFVPFSRLGAERSAVEGTGVGLALSKQLVEVMGGVIGVESTPGRGSTFWVELARVEPAPARPHPGAGVRGPAGADGTPTGPWDGGHRSGDGAPQDRASWRRDGDRSHPDHPHPEADRSPPDPPSDPPVATPPPGGAGVGVGARNGATGAGAGGNGARTGNVVVLHIEDNASNASLVEQVLAKRPGVRLISAAEGRSGLELARQHHPDLVLLDLHLPDLPGDELLHRLKAVPELADTKIVVVSADATPGRIKGMLDLGVEGYLTKPVDVEALLRLVDHEIGVKQGEPR